MTGTPPGGRASSLPLPLAGFRAGAPSGSCSPFPWGRLAIPTQPAGIRRAQRVIPPGASLHFPRRRSGGPAPLAAGPGRAPGPKEPPQHRRRPLRFQPAEAAQQHPRPGCAPRAELKTRDRVAGEDFPGGAEAVGSSSFPRVSPPPRLLRGSTPNGSRPAPGAAKTRFRGPKKRFRGAASLKYNRRRASFFREEKAERERDSKNIMINFFLIAPKQF